MMQPGQQGMVAPPPSMAASQPSMDQSYHQQQQIQLLQQQQYQQQWMAQQAPQQQQQQQASQQPQQQYQQQPAATAEDVRTLWIGDLQYWMDENYIRNCFAHTGELSNVKIIRNKQTMQSECYGFLEFTTHAAAERILQTYNNTLMPNVEQNYRLNWAFYGSGEKRGEDASDYTIFVGDLATDVTDYTLQETFRVRYPSVKGAKVVMDRLTGRAKGYGFVRFSDESEQLRAMSEMNGMMCSGRAMRIGAAANKKNVGGTASYQNSQGTQNDSDPSNTTIFVGNLDSNVSDEILRQTFSPYGELVHVKIPMGKQCGFVQFTNRSSAEEALKALNGVQLGGRSVRLSWGRSPSNRPSQPDQSQWNNSAYYGYPQGYDSYGYVSAPQDPNMYYGGYPGYGGYPMPQQAQMPLQQQQ
ncbi:polyadenylate-binding protein RBP45-like [Chenopodium quinoa]|uniref:polyadenylate-binding protein RBP45-like n=1 Tax=Chenopodium quinoa TaxID=63459 RepID=UPI000B777959|nr:polyadenylate-binding protein RBP45-like [Chenopodium quinoa]